MMRLSATTLLLLILSAGSSEAEQKRAAERWRFNSRAQTAQGLQALSAMEPETAVDHFATAYRLDPENPVTVFNHATARLLTGQPDAVAEVRELVGTLPPDLASEAHYNLGNALLDQGNPGEAIESYKSALRLDPDLFDAKFNLELARRLVEEQQEQQPGENGQRGRQDEQQQDQNQQEQKQDQQESSSQQSQPDDSGKEQKEGSNETQEEPQPDDGTDGESDGSGERERPSPLPGFEEQQDMTAEQAGAILEAIENLEREQRRRQAEERARRRALEGKDW
jgi:tetratricopeptide (TPR) repeat protein